MTVRSQSQEQAIQCSKITDTHPLEDGSVAQETDPATLVTARPKVGRHDPCACGSREKYGACHVKLG